MGDNTKLLTEPCAVPQHGGSFGASEKVANHNAPILDCNAPTPNFDISGQHADSIYVQAALVPTAIALYFVLCIPVTTGCHK